MCAIIKWECLPGYLSVLCKAVRASAPAGCPLLLLVGDFCVCVCIRQVPQPMVVAALPD